MFRKCLLLLFMCYFFAFPSEASHVSLPVRLLIQKGMKKIPKELLKFDENNRVELLVETDNPQEIKKWLRLNGGDTGSFADGILTVRVPVSHLSDFIKVPSVFRVTPSRKLKPLLDISRQKVSAGDAEFGNNLPRGINGTDTIIGIVDTGIDYTHPDFKNPDGSTRIIALWDQTINGTPPPDFGYGAECGIDSINDGTCREIDTDPDFSHGTHVAGIAGGSHTTYRGIAPSGMFVIVKTRYTEGTVIDGVDYVFKVAEKYKKPAVVNLSLGGNYGPHDGTSELVRALEALQGPGKVIVSAAGNSGDAIIHAGGNVTSENWYVMDYKSQETTAGLDIWYDAYDTLDFAIAALRQDKTLCAQSPFVPPGQSKEVSLSCTGLDCGTAYIDTTDISYPGNGDRNVLVIIESPSETQDLSKCRWALVAKPNSTDPDGGNFDAWITTDNGEFTRTPVLLPFSGSLLSIPGDSQKTISIPSDGKNIIAVGSYTSKTSWRAKDGNDYTCDGCVENDISYFSSMGPTRDGRIKPDITAPGEWIASAKSSNVTQIPSSLLLPDNGHFMLQGTSMASPHVTGAVALLFDMNPGLNADEIKNLINTNANVDSFTGTVPNNTWGYGKLDVYKALQNVSRGTTDTTPPLIFDIVLEMKETSINVSWKTDELTNSKVRLNYNNNEERVLSKMSYTTEHNFTISGIEPGRVFRIELTSSDPRGNSSSVTNLPGLLPNEGCGCNNSGGDASPLIFVLPFLLLSGILFIRRIL